MQGNIRNRENNGNTAADLIQRWNAKSNQRCVVADWRGHLYDRREKSAM